MKPLRLYIKNFTCHSNSFIDFTKFSSAIIVGKIDNNDYYSNGVGKTAIFKAIEYVLFNQSNVNLEEIIKDDSNFCQVVIDFLIDNQEYRLCRIRTNKSAEVSLLKRKETPSLNDEAYHTVLNNIYEPISDKDLIKKYWEDISGRRAADTEKEISKLLKINYKSFISTRHFIQNDLSGLSSTTPEKRKGILKEVLNLAVYSKLEKISKEKSNSISKNIEQYKTIINSIGEPLLEVNSINSQINSIKFEIDSKNNDLLSLNLSYQNVLNNINLLIKTHSELSSKYESLLAQKKILTDKNISLEKSIKDYTNKKTDIIKQAKDLKSEIDKFQNEKESLLKTDFSQIELINNEIEKLKEEYIKCNLIIQNNMSKYEELKIPMPTDGVCKHCRQVLSEEHRKVCINDINKEINSCLESIKINKVKVNNINSNITNLKNKINSLLNDKSRLDLISNKIENLSKEIKNKKATYSEYITFCNAQNFELNSNIDILKSIEVDLEKSSVSEAEQIKSKIDSLKKESSDINLKQFSINKEINHLSNTLAVLQNTIIQKVNDNKKKEEYNKLLSILEEEFSIYPSVLEAFSSTGIPNLIIQNVLDDLQIESNNLLMQLKPGLQLSFVIEKTKTDGTQDDTLDIKYSFNGRDRSYEQLSGAMKLSILFSLKLGLAFLLQKMFGMDLKFLLLDEVDQCLDKAGVDAFTEIVKFFQNDFNILVITHNDRLKDKFSHAILVEQNSKTNSSIASVVSNW